MAFGESLGIVTDRTRQVEQRDDWSTGPFNDIRFKTTEPQVAESIMHVFDVGSSFLFYIIQVQHKSDSQSLPLMTFFPAISHFFTRLTPSYRRHARVLDGYLKTKLANSRAKARTLGTFIRNGRKEGDADH
jgi:hypothetical protein